MPKQNDPLVTISLPPIHYPIPETLDDVMSEGGSVAGFHAVMTYYQCPEKQRLKALKVKRITDSNEIYPGQELSAVNYGSLIHALLAVRQVHGPAAALALLDESHPIGNALHEEQRMSAWNIMQTYNQTWPLDRDVWEVLGVEVTVVSNVGNTTRGPCYRTARYDKVIRVVDGKGVPEVYSFETKTSSRAGSYTLLSYYAQFMAQVAIWNVNPYLVERYGRMRGVMPDMVIKTKVPKCERPGVKFISPRQEELAREFLRNADIISFPQNADGSSPHFIQNCYGEKWGPCEYADLCVEGAVGPSGWY